MRALIMILLILGLVGCAEAPPGEYYIMPRIFGTWFFFTLLAAVPTGIAVWHASDNDKPQIPWAVKVFKGSLLSFMLWLITSVSACIWSP